MSKRANPTLIGAFVVGALALAVAGLLVFGSGRFFQKTYPFVLFFDGDVNGLNVGAPVKFMGVNIGQVTRILIQITPGRARVPVYIELDQNKLEAAGVRNVDLSDAAVVRNAIDNGLCAQLQAESLVTGVLFVQLKYAPDASLQTVGKARGIPEIPTLPTQIEQLKDAVQAIVAKLDALDVKGLVEELTKAAQAIAAFPDSPEMKAVLRALDETLQSLRELSVRLDGIVGPLGRSLEETVAQTRQVAKELEGTLSTARSLIAPDAPLAVQLGSALDEIRAAARAVQSLADYLDRNPNAVLFGREQGENP